jgi:hypothetical protein
MRSRPRCRWSARTLGVELSQTLLATADDVIE